MRKGKSIIKLISLLLLSITLLYPMTSYASSNNEHKVIIVFKENHNKEAISQKKDKVSHEFKHINAVAISLSDKEIARLQKDSSIDLIEEDTLVHIDSQIVDWGITKIAAPEAWSSSYTGNGVKVAVIDTGITIHPDLQVAGGTSFVSYTPYYSDDNGHGTHVSGIISALNNDIGIVGVAPAASIYALKALDNTGSGYISDIIAGLDWSITNKMDIVNMSFGSSTPSKALEQVVNKAYSDGLLIVAATGNSGTSSGKTDTVNYPAKYTKSVIAVSAIDNNNQRPYWSSTGKEVEVCAPGVSIFSTYLDGQYATMSGTSMATPFVTGDLALLKQKYPTYTNIQLRSILDKNILDLGTRGRDTFFGYGLIQARS